MNLLTGRERRLEGSEAGTGKHRHVGPGAELGNGVTLLCCKSPRKIVRDGSRAAVENSVRAL